MPTETDTTSLSVLLRSRTTPDHRQAEGSGFPTALMRGEVPLEGYVDMLAQHRYAYECLERGRDRFLEDPELAPFLDARLSRSAALEADLVDLAGSDWRVAYPASEATAAYCARLEASTDSSVRYLAHHYTRYLGDLSGGQHLGAAAARAYGFGPGRAGRFATFEEISDVAAYRDGYRALLDGLDWSADQQEDLVAEVRQAYACNDAVFAELTRHLS